MAEEYEQEAEQEAEYEEPAQEQEQEAEPEAEQEYAQEAEAEAEAEPEQEYQEPEAEVEEAKAEPEPEPEAAPAYDMGDMPASVADACTDIYSNNPTLNWFSAKLADPSLKKTDLVMANAGKGGLNELRKQMMTEKDFIVFFLLRCDTEDDEGSSRAKFVYGRFVGTGVKFMQKAKLTPNLGAIADQFQVKHLSKDADEGMKEWTTENLGKEFLRIGGAHKPQRYNFGPGAVYTVQK